MPWMIKKPIIGVYYFKLNVRNEIGLSLSEVKNLRRRAPINLMLSGTDICD